MSRFFRGIRTSQQKSSSPRKEEGYGIRVLHNPSAPAIDIVFLHGLTGSAYTTWLHKKSDVYWPRDLLKHDIKDARIMTFGYDADVVNFWNHAAVDSLAGYAADLLGSLADERRGDSVRVSSVLILLMLWSLYPSYVLILWLAESQNHLRCS
jgi:protein SERAC1